MEAPKQKTYYEFEDNEFDVLVEKYLGFEYECVAENEWNNDSCYTSDNVKKTDMNDEYNKKYWLPEIEEAIDNSSGSGLSFHQILAYLVWKEFLPEGNYIINCSW